MGTCYCLIEPVGQVALDVDKAGHWLYSDADLPFPFTVADMLRLRPERTDVIAWMRLHCGERPVYVFDRNGEVFPPFSNRCSYPWGIDGRRTGWNIYNESDPEGPPRRTT